MTLKKRLIIYLSAVLACLLFACGGGEGGKEDPVHIGVSGVELSETSYSMVVGDSLLLKAVITPSDATDQTVNWDSSEESVAVVSSSGLVSAVGKGTCVITASVDGKSARCTITVQDKTIAVESIVLSEDTLLLGIDDTATLIATIRPENATEREITWTSSNPEIATVSDQGEVVALQEGTCTVTVSAGGKSAECVVTVSRNVIPVKEVILSETSLTLKEGESYTLTATVTPADATERTVTWKSGNPDVATVSDEGKIEAVHAGTCIITASAGGKVSECMITVTSETIAVEQITLSATSLSLKLGDSRTLTATVIPSDATDSQVTWSSSDPSVATVSDQGEVTAVRAGNCTITATAGGKSAACTVTVSTQEIPVERITLSSTSLSLKEGDSHKLTATVTPSDATDSQVTWSSSDPSVATVSDQGEVTAVRAGNCTITATAGSKSAACTVTVSTQEIPVERITLSSTSLSLKEGDSHILTATVTPSDATDSQVTWSSSDPSVATVSNTGKVVAVRGGNCTITATAGGKSATCMVTVSAKEIPVERITLSSTTLSLKEGDSHILTATVTPSDATDSQVTWSSSDPSVATVSNTGKVVAVRGGNCTITATAGGKSATCTVRVQGAGGVDAGIGSWEDSDEDYGGTVN